MGKSSGVKVRTDALSLVGLVRNLNFTLRATGGHWRVLSKNVKPSVLCLKNIPLAAIWRMDLRMEQRQVSHLLAD